MPGSKVVFVKNTDYVPRKEPPSWASGGKVVKVDRVEWIYIPDSATAAAALNAGEVDWWQMVPPDLVPLLAKNKDIKVENTDPLGSMGMIRFNQLQPPFNNPKMRQAVLYLVNQQDYALGDSRRRQERASPARPSSPAARRPKARSAREVLTGKRDLAKAKQLIEEAGYKGEKIVVLSATDQPIVHSQGLITIELLQSAGLNVELPANDWGTLDQPPRRQGADREGRLEHLPHLARSGPTWPTRRSTTPCAASARRRGSAGRPTRRWRSCATPGSTPPTPASRRS